MSTVLTREIWTTKWQIQADTNHFEVWFPGMLRHVQWRFQANQPWSYPGASFLKWLGGRISPCSRGQKLRLTTPRTNGMPWRANPYRVLWPSGSNLFGFAAFLAASFASLVTVSSVVDLTHQGQGQQSHEEDERGRLALGDPTTCHFLLEGACRRSTLMHINGMKRFKWVPIPLKSHSIPVETDQP